MGRGYISARVMFFIGLFSIACTVSIPKQSSLFAAIFQCGLSLHQCQNYAELWWDETTLASVVKVLRTSASRLCSSQVCAHYAWYSLHYGGMWCYFSK